MSKSSPQGEGSYAASPEVKKICPQGGAIAASGSGLPIQLHEANPVPTPAATALPYGWIAVAVLVVVVEAVVAAGLGPGNALTEYSYLNLLFIMLAAVGIAVFNAYRGDRASRSFWVLFALGMGIWALDQWLWVYYQFRYHTDVPNESIGDAALFLHTIPLMAALAARTHLQPSGQRLRQTTFRFLHLFFFWVFLYAYYVFPFQYLFPDPLTYGLRYNSLYFCENIALLLVAGLFIARSDWPWKLVYAHLFTAAGIYALTSERVNAALSTGSGFQPGGIYDLGFTASACWFVLAAIQGRSLPPCSLQPMPLNHRLARYATFLPILGVVTVPLVGIWDLYHVDPSLPLQKVHLLIILLFSIVFAAVAFLQLLVANLDLRHEVAVRLKAEEGLRESKAAAEAGNHAKAEFLANMSHEVRTPMNGIMGMTDLMLETPLTPEQREYMQMSKSSADSLLKIIDDILDFSKIDAGKLAMESVEFDPRDTLMQCVKFFSSKAAASGLKLVGKISPEVPGRVVGDPTRLRQIIVNLLGNALKFTEHGEIVLQVEKEVPASDEPFLHFSVHDTGVGIPREKQQVIFAPFAQADGSTTRKFGGTGLGLTISARLVHLMGGNIWVESQVGAGSTFHFTAWFGRAKLVQPQPSSGDLPSNSRNSGAADLIPPHPVHAEHPGLRVLLVEDNLVNQRLAMRLLEKHGYKVGLALNGRQALAAILQDSFDLVLMDVQMPEMDGFETTAAIREREKEMGAHLPIIAMTAHSMKGDREECMAAGMDGYVSKPIKPEDLFAAIEQVADHLDPPPVSACDSSSFQDHAA
jgi:signal transduction histidine kinase/CheY-like chemotaxis protein